MRNKTEKLSSDTPRNFGLLFKTTENYTLMCDFIIFPYVIVLEDKSKCREFLEL